MTSLDFEHLEYAKLVEIETHVDEMRAAKDRYETIKKFLDSKKDADAIELLDDLVMRADRYVCTVVAHERACKLAHYSTLLDERENDRLEAQSRHRRTSHNALIDSLVILNRFMSKYPDMPKGGIYTGNISDIVCRDRVAIADWAGYLALGLKWEFEQK